MDLKKIGELIYSLRTDKNLTQKQLAEKMNISDKAISKWERGQGCPDISLLQDLSEIFEISIESILSGEITKNNLFGGNMNKIKFYVCKNCNNLITSTQEATIPCCGNIIKPLEAKKCDDEHNLIVENVEDELFITSNHDMKKEHYISFVAYVKGERATIVKQYPEWNMEFRLNKKGRGRLYFYCTNDGLFYQNI